MEEVITLKESPEEETNIRNRWRTRIEGVEDDPSSWIPLLKVRSLALSPQANADDWIRLSALFRKQDTPDCPQRRLTLGLKQSQQILLQLLGSRNEKVQRSDYERMPWVNS